MAESWTGVPSAIADLLNRETNAVLAMPELREKRAASGTRVVPASVAETGAFVRSEVDKWAGVINAGNLRAE